MDMLDVSFDWGFLSSTNGEKLSFMEFNWLFLCTFFRWINLEVYLIWNEGYKLPVFIGCPFWEELDSDRIFIQDRYWMRWNKWSLGKVPNIGLEWNGKHFDICRIWNFKCEVVLSLLVEHSHVWNVFNLAWSCWDLHIILDSRSFLEACTVWFSNFDFGGNLISSWVVVFVEIHCHK